MSDATIGRTMWYRRDQDGARRETVEVLMAKRPWRTLRLPELAGSAEACEILGINKSTLTRWMQPGSGTHGPEKTYMITPQKLRATPVWVKSDVERFRDEIGRQRALTTSANGAPD